MLVAQAQIEKMCILTADEQITRYDVQIIWAGQGTQPVG
jgi:PIN domain nuclease of toxin-antitoxin system